MSRKDYVRFAGMIKEYVDGGQTSIPITCLIDFLCDYFAEDNENFDDNRFCKACGWDNS